MTAALPTPITPAELAASRARDKRDALAIIGCLVESALANIEAYGVTVDEVIDHLCAGPDGTLDPRRVARLALAGVQLADEADNRIGELLEPVGEWPR